MKNILLKIPVLLVITLVISFSTIIFITYSSYINSGNSQFSYQAQSFLHGKTDIPLSVDTISFNGKYYWHQNPFPSIFLIPGQILIGKVFNEPMGQIICIILLTVFLYKLAIIHKFNSKDSLWLVFAFLFGSVMIGLISWPLSWYYAQVLAVTILTIILYEFETKRRYLILGILEAVLIATRPTAAFIGILILATIIFKIYKKGFNRKYIYELCVFLFPVILSIFLLLIFNFIRFGTPFFNTYKAANPGLILVPLQKMGIFSFVHIPTNIYYFFLASFSPVTNGSVHLVFPFITFNRIGLSFFIVSPFFIYALKSFRKISDLTKAYWVLFLVTLFVLLCFFGIGYVTFGPRFTADFMPILFVILLYSFKQTSLTFFQRMIILGSASLNVYLLLTPFFIGK